MNNYNQLLLVGLAAVVNLVTCHREICSITKFNNIWEDVIKTENNCTSSLVTDNCHLKVTYSLLHSYLPNKIRDPRRFGPQKDPLLETLLGQFYRDSIKPQMNRFEPALGAVLDPLWLFPIGPLRVKKKMFRGQLTACNLHLHNLKVTMIKMNH